MTKLTLNQTVADLLEPLAGDAPAGRWMRYERAFIDLGKAREEDDPTLPMGEWERPLVRADWREVAESCIRLLDEDSKDFQIAIWLCDAWIRLHRLEGLQAGLALINGLVDRYWNSGWPAIEDGDYDRRVAPFVWLNGPLPITLKQHVLILPATATREMPVTLLDWETTPVAETERKANDKNRGKEREKKNDAPPTWANRQAIRDSIQPSDSKILQIVASQADGALTAIKALSERLDSLIPDDSLSLAQVRAVLESILAAAKSLAAEIPVSSGGAKPWWQFASLTAKEEQEPMEPPATTEPDDSPEPDALLTPDGVSAPPDDLSASPAVVDQAQEIATIAAVLSSREDAYRQLEAAAAFLQATEPHSPTPYLVRRAVRWGQMSLPELIQEAGSGEGALERFFTMLGMSSPR